ncbi:MAG: hypothetical protein ACLR7Z_01350 [Bilophila wadsworthia]
MDHDSPAEQWRRLQQRQATLFNSNFPKDAFDKLEAQLRAEGLLGQNQDLLTATRLPSSLRWRSAP